MNTVAHAEYRAVQRQAANDVVARHSELVARIAHHLITRLPASVDVNDLMQSGMIGLIEASRSFDASQGASFETYASIRIRGAMLDELRKGDWVPRSVHRHLRAATEATRAVEQKTGRAAKSSEVAAAMNMPVDDFDRLLADAVRGHVLSLDAHTAARATHGCAASMPVAAAHSLTPLSSAGGAAAIRRRTARP